MASYGELSTEAARVLARHIPELGPYVPVVEYLQTLGFVRNHSTAMLLIHSHSQNLIRAQVRDAGLDYYKIDETATKAVKRAKLPNDWWLLHAHMIKQVTGDKTLLEDLRALYSDHG